jgi:hypothetical protein
MCLGSIAGAPSRSATVRATFWDAVMGAGRQSALVHSAFKKALAIGGKSQKVRMWRKVICALE